MGLPTSGTSGYVQELYRDKTKKYHLDELKTCCLRGEANNMTSIHRTAMAMTEFSEQRAHSLIDHVLLKIKNKENLLNVLKLLMVYCNS